MTEFSQRAAVIEDRKTALVDDFAAALGRQPTSVEVLKLRQRATLETRPAKEHHSLERVDERVARASRELHRRRPMLLGGRTGRSQRSAPLARRRPGR